MFYQLAGENIAAQYMDGPSAVEGWLNSEGHRESLLESKFTHIGVGVYQKILYTKFYREKLGKINQLVIGPCITPHVEAIQGFLLQKRII